MSDHDLPMLRVHYAWADAQEYADEQGIDPKIALEISRRTIDIIGQGTRRWGHLCTTCRGKIDWQKLDGRDYPVCPNCGRLGPHEYMALLISFDPVVKS